VGQGGFMSKEETHTYEAGCGLTLHITISDEGYFVRCGKGGECHHQSWEVIAELLNHVNPKKAVEILKNRVCPLAINKKDSVKEAVSNKSCYHKVGRMIETKFIENIKGKDDK
jgi:hypothetical protein